MLQLEKPAYYNEELLCRRKDPGQPKKKKFFAKTELDRPKKRYYLFSKQFDFSSGHLLFIRDQLNHMLRLGSRGYLLDDVSHWAFNEGNFCGNKITTKVSGWRRL